MVLCDGRQVGLYFSLAARIIVYPVPVYLLGRWVPKNPSTSADMHRDQAFSAPIDTNMGKISQPQDSTAASDQAHSDRDAVAGTVKSASASASAGAGTSQTTQLRAMSLENIAGPGTYSLFHQKEYLLTFPTPTR